MNVLHPSHQYAVTPVFTHTTPLPKQIVSLQRPQFQPHQHHFSLSQHLKRRNPFIIPNAAPPKNETSEQRAERIAKEEESKEKAQTIKHRKRNRYQRDIPKFQKQWQEVRKQIGWTPLEPLDALKELRDAINVLMRGKYAEQKKKQTIVMSMRTFLDPRDTQQRIRGTVSLPHGTGKEEVIAVICSANYLADAKAAGATFVGEGELIAKIAGGFTDFKKLIATPDMMPKLAKLGRILGPKGLMPNPKAGTVTTNVTEAIAEYKGGKVEFRLDQYGSMHAVVGRTTMPDQKIIENLEMLLQAIDSAKPEAVESVDGIIKAAYLTGNFSPGVPLSVEALRRSYKAKGAAL